MTQRQLQELPPAECLSLLRRGSVGRVVFVGDEGPTAIPVNYAMAGDAVVFRVEGGAKRAAAQAGQDLAFEVDEVDGVERSAWSVLVRGPSRELRLDQVPDVLKEMGGHIPTPWAAGVHNAWVEITPRTVTGRRLGPPVASTVF